MPDLFIDIETVPGQAPLVREAILAEIDAEASAVAAPSNYKDPAKIADYIAGERARIVASFDARHRKTALSGLLGEVLCVSWALDDDPVQTQIRRLDQDQKPFLDAVWEAILEDWAAADARRRGSTTWIGHNIRDFDLRFLFQRSVILGSRPGLFLPHDASPSSDAVYDTMTRWAGWGNRIKLDALCRALGIPGKDADGMDGSMVYDTALAGDYDKIATYCAHDVERVRAVYRRMTFSTPSTRNTQ